METREIFGEQPIHLGCQKNNGSLEIIEYLVNKGIDLESEDNHGQRPIHFACQYNGTLKMIEYLVHNGINLESATNYGWRPIHFVCSYGCYDVINFFLKRNVNLCGRVTRPGILGYYDVKDLIKENNQLTAEQQKELLDIINEKKIEI